MKRLISWNFNCQGTFHPIYKKDTNRAMHIAYKLPCGQQGQIGGHDWSTAP